MTEPGRNLCSGFRFHLYWQASFLSTFCKSHLSRILSRLLPNCDPLRRVRRWFSTYSVGHLFCQRFPNQHNPNLFLIGNGFGSWLFFDRYESTYFRNGIRRRSTSKSRGTWKKNRFFKHRRWRMLFSRYTVSHFCVLTLSLLSASPFPAAFPFGKLPLAFFAFVKCEDVRQDTARSVLI